ncbi:chloride channel protein 2-like isoform X2 [Panonychus citri]|uniref:chloride channel protein 2-like isoform X2 n=1 Tax=Panonychus citri TaxID=50023 RepID=UPI002306F66D|nr:chloride channel protein 2-like isoform X2 [Panonychus citri]
MGVVSDSLVTYMYGQYREDLGRFAKAQARRMKSIKRKEESSLIKKGFKKYQSTWKRKFSVYFQIFWKHSFAKIGEDWIFLALLGMSMAFLSFFINIVIESTVTARQRLYKDFTYNSPVWKFIGWTSTPVLMILFASGFVHIVAPQAVGSGIPEMKTILGGVVLNEYLTFRTLIAKIVGLSFTLASGLPLGREGPFVHISSIIATLMSRMVTTFKGIYENESRTGEMLAAACAVGVAATFYTPIGGVLFSIEVTSVYFAVRNYWRGFFAACCGATIWRLLTVWIKDASISALFRTSFKSEFPFDPQELFIFALIGTVCGFGGACYVAFHRKIVQFNRNHKRWNQFLQLNRFLYPGLVTFIITSCTFPPFLGKYMTVEVSTHHLVDQLFSNITWGSGSQDYVTQGILKDWTTDHTSFYFHLCFYIFMTWWTSALASTIPVPSGVFIPVFLMGAAFGRLVGEIMAVLCPDGIPFGDRNIPIVPGGYAVVGAAAFAGAVTHTISTTVIVFELTGQMSHIIPVIMSVLIANGIAQSLKPSIYDSIIEIKKLPFLPSIKSTSSTAHRIMVDDIMTRDVVYVWRRCSYKDLLNTLETFVKIETFPLVDTPSSMILLGSIQRHELRYILNKQLSKEKRLQEVQRRYSQQDVMRTFSTLPSTMESSRESLTQPKTPEAKSRFEVRLINSQNDGFTTGSAGSGASSIDGGKSGPKRSSPPPSPTMGTKTPVKSILKQTATFTTYSPNSTITQDFRLRQAFENIFMKSLKLQDAHPSKVSSGVVSNSAPSTPSIQRRVQLPRERVIDMSPEEQLAWEEEQLNSIIDLSACHIDPAPFQLVEQTSLIKVHSLFSMLQLNLAYVTSIGRLVGVVTLKDIRIAIERMNNGTLVPKPRPSPNIGFPASDGSYTDTLTSVATDESNPNVEDANTIKMATVTS